MRQFFLVVIFSLLPLTLFLTGCGSTPATLTQESLPVTTVPSLTPEFSVTSLNILPSLISTGESTDITAVV